MEATQNEIAFGAGRLPATWTIPEHLRRTGPRVALGVAAVIALSTVQIFGRLALDGASPGWLQVLWLNAVATAPWLALAVPILRLSRTRPWPADGSAGRRARWLAHHLVAALAASSLFLVSLTIFRFAFFPEVTGTLTLQGFAAQWGREATDFFHVCLVVYGLIAASATSREAATSTPSEDRSGEPRGSFRFEIRGTGKTRWIDADRVRWIEAAGSYARLHLDSDGSSVLLRTSMRRLEDELAPEGFVRAHRSALVRLDRVAELRPLGHGDAVLRLDSDAELRVSRTYRQRLEERLAAL